MQWFRICHLLTSCLRVSLGFLMPYPWMANGVSQRSLYLGETRESADEGMQQKREN